MSEHSIGDLCLSKLAGVVIRLSDFVRWIPKRLHRIGIHLWSRITYLIRQPRQTLKISGHLHWFIEFLLLWLDLLGVTEVYETVCDFVKFNSRPLSSEERKIAQAIFGSSIPLRRIRIDESSFAGPRFYHFAYVSFCTINSWGPLPEAILVHELTHVWQYHRLGSIYIPLALRAQYSESGYDYGGEEAIRRALGAGGFGEFNLEQQADIVADYYRLQIGKRPRWTNSSFIQADLFEQLLTALR